MEAHGNEGTSAGPPSPVVILFVSDHDSNARDRCARLSDGAIRFLPAAGYFAALSAIHTTPPDLLVTDLSLKEGTGFELVAALRRLRPNAPVLLLSSEVTPEARARASALPWVELQPADLDADELRRHVLSLLSRGRKQTRILVADDHDQTRGLLQETLTRAGYEVTTAADCSEALTAVRESSTPFDIAIIDWAMPGGNGGTVIDEIRKLHPVTIPILLTGEATGEEIRYSYDHGAYSLIRKPIRSASLLSYLQDLAPEMARRRSAPASSREETLPPSTPLQGVSEVLGGAISSKGSYTIGERFLQLLLLCAAAALTGCILLKAFSLLESLPRPAAPSPPQLERPAGGPDNRDHAPPSRRPQSR